MTEKETLKNLKIISETLKNTLNFCDDDTKGIVKSCPELLKADINTIKESINLFANVYVANKRYISSMIINHPSVLLDSKKVKDAAEVLCNRFGFKQHNIGNILCNNACIITDFDFFDINPYLNQIKSETGVGETCLRNMFLFSTIFGNQYTYMVDTLNEKIKLLEIYGVKKESIEEIPSILGNSILKMSTRVKLAMISGLSIDEFIHNKNFIINEKTIYSRMMENAKQGNLTPAKIYGNPLTSEEQYNLIRKYPFDKNAQEFVNREFSVLYPQLNAQINKFFDEMRTNREQKTNSAATTTVSETNKMATTIENPSTQSTKTEIELPVNTAEQIEEKITPSHIRRAMRILGVGEKGLNIICHSLGIENFDQEKLNHIMNTHTLLLSYGFDSVEILAHPNCLKLDADKLETRVKLARINARTNTQFLTRDYKYSEETIFARTCGVKIMARQTGRPTNVYDSETNFSKAFGGDTKTLVRLCELNEKNRNVLEILYSKSQNNNENEN